jgi:hypothetical protein
MQFLHADATWWGTLTEVTPQTLTEVKDSGKWASIVTLCMHFLTCLFLIAISQFSPQPFHQLNSPSRSFLSCWWLTNLCCTSVLNAQTFSSHFCMQLACTRFWRWNHLACYLNVSSKKSTAQPFTVSEFRYELLGKDKYTYSTQLLVK